MERLVFGFWCFQNSTAESNAVESKGNPDASQLYTDVSQLGSFFSWVQAHVPWLCSSGSLVDLLEYTSILRQLYIILYSEKCVSFRQAACLYTAKHSTKMWKYLKTLKSTWCNYCKRGWRQSLHCPPPPTPLLLMLTNGQRTPVVDQRGAETQASHPSALFPRHCLHSGRGQIGASATVTRHYTWHMYPPPTHTHTAVSDCLSPPKPLHVSFFSFAVDSVSLSVQQITMIFLS